MSPLVFNGMIGWLHEAPGRRGVVVAGSHGFEDLCSRRFLTLIASRIAANGLPVLQFDYPGCGDSAGDHTEPGRVAAWTKGVDAAVDRLKAETGVSEVAVLGFRLGALLAMQAAARRNDITELALLAPPASGKSFVRELVGLSRMVDAALPAPTVAETFDGLQAAGFRMTKETVEAFRTLDPFAARERLPFVRRVLVMARGEAVAADAVAQAFQGSPASVSLDGFAGYDRLMCDPTAGEIPAGVVERCADWFGNDVGRADKTVTLRPTAERLVGPDFEEEPAVIGPAPRICGVLCRPRGVPQSSEAFVFLNAGGVPHVGWARGTVEEARGLAARGVASLRIDLPGLGQSEAPERPGIFLYDMKTRTHVSRVIDWLGACGFKRISLVGTCSGAFQSFHAARADPRVASVTMVNPLCFAWNTSYALDMTVWKTYEASKVAFGQSKSAPGADRDGGPLRRVRSAVSWVLRRSIRRGLEVTKSAFARVSTGLVSASPVERWMRHLTARGTRVLMVNCDGDLSLEEVDRHFGPGAQRLRAMPGVAFLRIPAADHTLTPVHARRLLVDELTELTLNRRAATPIAALEPEAAEEAWSGSPGAKAGRPMRAATSEVSRSGH